MTYPTKPDASYDYSSYQASSPADPLPGNQVEADFAEHKTSIDEIIDFQALIQRSDGNLQNGSVRPESFSSGALALVNDGVSFRGDWVTLTAYAVNDIVANGGSNYICLVAHVAGTFATDLAAGKWMLIDAGAARLTASQTFTGTNEFDGATNFDGAVDFDGAIDATGSASIALGANATATTPAVGTSSTALATMAALQAAVGKVYIQTFTSIPTTITVTVATPAVLSWTAHGLAVGQAFQVTTSGTLPTGMALLTTYFVISAGYGANSFQFSATRGGAAINTSGSQSGTHTATPFYAPSAGMVKSIGETWGGGGGGGGAVGAATGGESSSAGGGGAGGYSRKLIAAADVAAAGVAVTVGAAGTAGAAGNNAGGNGGDTSIGSLCIAKGGSGGAGHSGVSVTTSAGGAGGIAGTGDDTGTGQRGQSGTSFSHLYACVGGSTSRGSGGSAAPSGSSSAGSAVAATGFGAGGGGGIGVNGGGNVAGGAGTAGYVVITEFCNQ